MSFAEFCGWNWQAAYFNPLPVEYLFIILSWASWPYGDIIVLRAREISFETDFAFEIAYIYWNFAFVWSRILQFSSFLILSSISLIKLLGLNTILPAIVGRYLIAMWCALKMKVTTYFSYTHSLQSLTFGPREREKQTPGKPIFQNFVFGDDDEQRPATCRLNWYSWLVGIGLFALTVALFLKIVIHRPTLLAFGRGDNSAKTYLHWLSTE